MRLFWIIVLISSLSFAQSPSEKISTYFQYEGYSSPAYKSFIKSSEYVPMEDGVKLAVDILIPTEGPVLESFPAIVMYTPYQRSYVLPKMGLAKHAVSSMMGMGWGPVFDISIFDHVKKLLSYGYVLVSVDMRGTGASFGTQMPLMPQLGKDGKTLIDWIEKQSWCDGKVGMMGPSYLGWSQFLTAAHQPKALKCIMPEVIGFDMYTGGNRPGGIAATRWLKGFSKRLSAYNRNDYNFKLFILPAAPVVDEDGDGKLKDERPLLDSAMLAGTKAISYKDGQTRGENIYFKATQAHLENVPVARFLEEDSKYFDSHGPPPYEHLSFYQSNPGYYTNEVAASGIAIYHIGGWLDGFTRGTTKLYASMRAGNPSKLMISPRVHFPVIPKAYQKYLGYTSKYLEDLATEQLRFFDYHLKGIDNGIMQEAPVYVYVMNKGWRAADDWPLPQQEIQHFYLAAPSSLTRTTPSEGQTNYQVDFTHSSSYGKSLANRWVMYTLGPKKVMDRTEWDKKSLVFETAALKNDMEIVGHPIIDLWVSSDQAHGDFFVYLCDVDETGRSIYITEGQLRAGWHQLQDADEQVNVKSTVKPDLPWHGYKKEQWDEKPMENGQVIEMRFDMLPTAWMIKAGHRIRIAIAGVDRGNFELNPALCPDGKCPETRISVHHSSMRPSRIELPVIPADRKKLDR